MNFARQGFRVSIVSLSISCAVLFGCWSALGANAAGGPQVVRLNREFKLKAGEQVTLKRTRLRIKFVNVENDSRCPKDVTCVWAGNAAVQFRLSIGRKNKMVTLNTSGNAKFTPEIEYQGYLVKLVDLSPYPLSKQKIAAGDYIATLLVSKR